jgi:all-trans-retinol dehydrogenase (NAD+)
MPGNIRAYICDISDKNKVYLAEKVKTELGIIDILLNNAGVVRSDPFLDKPDAAIERMVAVNLLALFWTTKAFLSGTMAKDAGYVVNISSAGGLLAVLFISDYCTTKFGVVGFTESLRQEVKFKGYKKINFIYICPNTVNTGCSMAPKRLRGPRCSLPRT